MSIECWCRKKKFLCISFWQQHKCEATSSFCHPMKYICGGMRRVGGRVLRTIVLLWRLSSGLLLCCCGVVVVVMVVVVVVVVLWRRQMVLLAAYVCRLVECGVEQEIKPKEPIRCRDCGHRIMYKKRTK